MHVDDVAAAIDACLLTPATIAAGYDLPGGEALGFTELARRTLARHCPRARLIRCPSFVFGLAVRARTGWRGTRAGSGWLARLSQDQSADIEPARRAFGYSPPLSSLTQYRQVPLPARVCRPGSLDAAPQHKRICFSIARACFLA